MQRRTAVNSRMVLGIWEPAAVYHRVSVEQAHRVLSSRLNQFDYKYGKRSALVAWMFYFVWWN